MILDHRDGGHSILVSRLVLPFRESKKKFIMVPAFLGWIAFLFSRTITVRLEYLKPRTDKAILSSCTPTDPAWTLCPLPPPAFEHGRSQLPFGRHISCWKPRVPRHLRVWRRVLPPTCARVSASPNLRRGGLASLGVQKSPKVAKGW